MLSSQEIGPSNALQPAPQQPSPLDLLNQHHEMLRAQFGKLKEARGMLDHVRREMDRLVKLSDTVTPDDVVKASGRLVGHGLGNAAIAEILATMPSQGGQPLAEWVKQHDQDVRLREAHLDLVKNQMGHHLAVAGLRMLAVDHLTAPQEATQAAPVESGAIDVENSLQRPQ